MTLDQTRAAIERNVDGVRAELRRRTGATPHLIVLVGYELWGRLYTHPDLAFSPISPWMIRNDQLHVFGVLVAPADAPLMPSPDAWKIVIDSGVGSHLPADQAVTAA